MSTPFWQTPGGAATITAGANILDGAFGGGSRGMSTQRSQARKMRKQGYKIDRSHYEKMYASHVKGAKAAGLHPLFAMGAGLSGSSPSFSMSGQSERGSGVADAVSATLSAAQQQALYNKQGDLVDKQIQLAQARALEQVMSNDNSELVTDPLNYGPVKRGTVKVRPAEVITSEDGGVTEAGTHPGWKRYRLAHDLVIDSPVEKDELFTEPGGWIPVLADKQNRENIQNFVEKRTNVKLPKYTWWKNPHGQILNYVKNVIWEAWGKPGRAPAAKNPKRRYRR